MTDPYDLENFFSAGPWAVIDAFYGTIWINVEQHQVAKLVSSTFRAKINPVIVDISQAENYHPALVDSTISLDWILEIDNESYVETVPYLGDTPERAELVVDVGYTAKNKLLLNVKQKMSLSVSQQKEIQSQIFSFLCVLRQLWGNVVYRGRNVLEENFELFREISLCYGAEKTLPDIEKRLFQIGLDYMDSCPTECLFLLGQLDKLYE